MTNHDTSSRDKRTPVSDAAQAAAHTMTRRALLKTGWVAPVVLAVGLSGWTANVSTTPDPGDPAGDPLHKPGMHYFGQTPDHAQGSQAGQGFSSTPLQPPKTNNEELRSFVRGLRGKKQ